MEYRIFYYAVCKVSYRMLAQILKSVTRNTIYRVSVNYLKLINNVIDLQFMVHVHIYSVQKVLPELQIN